MSIDIICLLLMTLAAFKGYRKGLIVALASFAAFFIGLAAAVKLSATVASQMNPKSPWVPFLAFLLVFLISSWLVGMLGRMIHKGADLMMAGLINRIGGMIMYLLTYALIMGLFLFFAGKTGLVSEKTFSDSVACRHLVPLGREIFEGLGHFIPFFRDMFSQLLDFFEGVNNELIQP